MAEMLTSVFIHWKQGFDELFMEAIKMAIMWVVIAGKGTAKEFENGNDHTTCWLFLAIGALLAMGTLVLFALFVIEGLTPVFFLLSWGAYALAGSVFLRKDADMEEV